MTYNLRLRYYITYLNSLQIKDRSPLNTSLKIYHNIKTPLKIFSPAWSQKRNLFYPTSSRNNRNNLAIYQDVLKTKQNKKISKVLNVSRKKPTQQIDAHLRCTDKCSHKFGRKYCIVQNKYFQCNIKASRK